MNPFQKPYKKTDPSSDELFFSWPAERSAKWSISWADIMMTMFILFVVLYLYQAHNHTLKLDSENGVNTVSHTQEKNRQQPSQVFKKANLAIMDPFVTTTQVSLVQDKAVRIALSGDLLFDLGKADLKLEAQHQLDRIGGFLKENDYVINVVGHTDNIPSTSQHFPSNWELSTARASRVARFLIETAHLPENRFFVSGHAWLKPLYPNTTFYNRSLNRRVEIILMKDMPYWDQASDLKPLSHIE